MSLNITKLSADEFLVRQLPVIYREYTHTKLVDGALEGEACCFSLTADFVRKLAALKIGDTIAWDRPTRIDITKQSANEFLGREYPNDGEVKCSLTGELLEIEATIRPLYLNPETVSKLVEMKVGDVVTLNCIEDSEIDIDCPLCGSPMCGATTKEWRID